MSYTIIQTAPVAQVKAGDLGGIDLRPAAGNVIEGVNPTSMRVLADRLYDAATDLDNLLAACTEAER